MDKKQLFSDINNDMVKLFGKNLKKIILYGSYAKNKQNKESDIDFIVLVDDTENNLRKSKYQIADIMSKLSINYNMLVSITEETLSCYNEFSQYLPYYQNIRNEGIEIYG